MASKLARYGFPRSVVDAVAPVVAAIEEQGIPAAKQILADSAIEWCRRIESESLPPRVVDEYFTLLDLYLGEHGGETQLGEEAHQLLVEGMTLHHYGESSGTDLQTLQRLARKILRPNSG